MPLQVRVLVVGLALIGSVERCLAREADSVGTRSSAHIDAYPTSVQLQSGVVSTVRAGNLLFAAVSINSSPGSWWLVETGATMCEFDLETANGLHLKRSTRYKLITRSKTRGERAVIVEASDLLVGTIHCGPLVMLAHPLVPALRVSKSPANWPGAFDKTGLLGMNLLARYRCILDVGQFRHSAKIPPPCLSLRFRRPAILHRNETRSVCDGEASGAQNRRIRGE